MQFARSTARTLLIGIDDTDNLESRGTGYRARCLGARLRDTGLGQVNGISRHQLLVDDAIPYTSHNSAACLRLELTDDGNQESVIECCRTFLAEESAPGSDAGLCVSPFEKTGEALQHFGQRAQQEVLHRRQAETLARDQGIYLEGLTGDHGGVIGAMAAIGLRAAGDDGRFVWVEGIRERANEQHSIGDILELTGVELIMTLSGDVITNKKEILDLGPWPRPILRDGRIVLLVEENHDDENIQWRVVDKAIIKRY